MPVSRYNHHALTQELCIKRGGPVTEFVVAPWSAHLFSEGIALHLWQIRHIPNLRQTLLGLTTIACTLIASSVNLFKTTPYVSAQSEQTESEARKTSEGSISAAEFLQQVRQELPKHQSIKAELAQQISIGEQQFKVAGEYLSAGEKLRLAYLLLPDQGAQGEMLEVSDGKDLWTMISLSDSKRVTHRNIQQIFAAISAAGLKGQSDSSSRVELGLGGLTGLLASLDRTMTFDAIKSDETGGQSRMIIQGYWKKEFAKQFPRDKKDDSLPAYIPDAVRLYVNSQTLFPEKLVYLKKLPSKKSFRPLISLEFRNVEFDIAIDDDAFIFKVPDGVVPEDVTKQYVERITGTPK